MPTDSGGGELAATVLATARHLARCSPASLPEREAALTLIRASLSLLIAPASPGRPRLSSAVRSARRALAGTRDDGNVLEIVNLARVLSALEQAWNGGPELSANGMKFARHLLAHFDPKLAEIDPADLVLALARLRFGQVKLAGAIAEVLIATRALGTAAGSDRRQVETRVRAALRRRRARGPACTSPRRTSDGRKEK